MKTRKLLRVIIVLIGGILMGMALGDAINGQLDNNTLLSLIPSIVLTIWGTWQLIKE